MSNQNRVDSKFSGQRAQPRASTLSIVGRLTGAIGMVLLVSMLLTWILTQTIGVFLLSKLIVGLLGVAFYLLTNGDVFRKVAGGRSMGLLVMTGAGTIIVLGLVVVANYVASQSSKQWDFTREGIHTLSPQTTGLLKRLDKDVKIFAFYSRTEAAYPLVADVLGKYYRMNSRVQYEVIDPQLRPDLVEQYKITDSGPRLVVTAGIEEARAKSLTEEEITQAIMQAVSDTTKTIYYMTGHGEPAIDDGENAEGYKNFADALVSEGFKISPLSFVNPPKKNDSRALNLDASREGSLKVPNDVSYIVVAGSKSSLLEPELVALKDFVSRGGRLLVLVEHRIQSGIENLLSDVGIEVRDDLIVDPNPLNRMIGLGPAAPMVIPTEEEHPITKGLKVTAVVSTARSLGIKAIGAKSKLDFSPLALLRAGESAWGETNLADGMAEEDDGDTLEDVYAAVASTAPLGTRDATKVSNEARVVAFGDSDWLSNKYLSMQGNRDLILNVLNWLVEREDRISVRPSLRNSNKLNIHGEDLNYLKFFSMDILPVIFIAMGLGIVLVRRQR